MPGIIPCLKTSRPGGLPLNALSSGSFLAMIRRPSGRGGAPLAAAACAHFTVVSLLLQGVTGFAIIANLAEKSANRAPHGGAVKKTSNFTARTYTFYIC